jgi:hypothetical protein
LFASAHKECKKRHHEGRAHIDALVFSSVVNQRDIGAVIPEIDQVSRRCRVTRADAHQLVVHSWDRALDQFLTDGVLTREEEAVLVRSASALSISRPEMEARGVLAKVAMGRALRDISEGRIPQFIPQPVMPVHLNLQKSEELVWLFERVPYIEQVKQRHYVGATSGMSFRVAKGMYYRVGGIKGHSETTTEMRRVDEGVLGVTTKHLYFSGNQKSFRIPYAKIVSFQPYSDGLGVVKEAANPKPQVFVVGNGWFIYNLVMNVAQGVL